MSNTKILEWWFKDALNKKEKKIDDPHVEITQEIVDFYDGRLYQKEVGKPTTSGQWITIKP